MEKLKRSKGKKVKNIAAQVGSAVLASEWCSTQLQKYLDDCPQHLQYGSHVTSYMETLSEVPLTEEGLKKLEGVVGAYGTLRDSLRECTVSLLTAKVLEVMKRLAKLAGGETQLDDKIMRSVMNLLQECSILFPLDAELPGLHGQVAAKFREGSEKIGLNRVKAFCRKLLNPKSEKNQVPEETWWHMVEQLSENSFENSWQRDFGTKETSELVIGAMELLLGVLGAALSAGSPPRVDFRSCRLDGEGDDALASCTWQEASNVEGPV